MEDSNSCSSFIVGKVWCLYENYTKSDIIDTVKTTIKFTETMTYNGKNLFVSLIDQVYKPGVKLTKKR
jgi:hypothetical protein